MHTLTKNGQTRTIYASGNVVISSLANSVQLPRRRTCATAADAQAEAEQQAANLVANGWTRS